MSPTEEAAVCLRANGIDDDNGGVRPGGGGLKTVPRDIRRWQRCWRRKTRPKTSTSTTEALVEDRRRVQGMEDNEGGGIGSAIGPMDCKRRGVSIFLAIASLTVTLYRIFLVAVSFWYYFHQIPFFVCCKKYYQFCNHVENIFVPGVH